MGGHVRKVAIIGVVARMKKLRVSRELALDSEAAPASRIP